jgi:Putative amidoligase enzyme
MVSGSGTSEAGEASSSPARVGISGAGQLVLLPRDRFAVDWWLARQTVSGDGVPYAADGVLALWPDRRAETDGWTFGLELEFAVADAGWVAAELHAIGLCAVPEPLPYHAPRAGGSWVVEQDRSVSTVFAAPDGGPPIVVGGEVVSPPLRDTPETWQQVAAVLDVLRRCGAEVNRSCGLHIHFGADALRPADGPPRDLLLALSRLAILTSVCFEDLVFRMASAEGGQHRGQSVYYRHCRPLERPLQPAYESLSDLAGALGLEGAARRAALNLTNVGDPQKDTVEFRHCNGTLDGRVIQAFTRLCAALIGAARWTPAAALFPPAPLGQQMARRLAAPDEDARIAVDADPQPLWDFLGAVFPEGLPLEAAGSLRWLFRRGAWQPGLADLGAR